MALVKLRPAIWPIKYFVLAMAAPATLCAAGLMVASCGPIQSAQVQDQINGMIGLSKERVLSCMGPPTSTAQAGATAHVASAALRIGLSIKRPAASSASAQARTASWQARRQDGVQKRCSRPPRRTA